MPSWQVHLFGPFECFLGDSLYNLPAVSDARSLLAYLLLHKTRAFPRSVLAALIAPDSPDAQARHALSQALWHIRRSMPGLLMSDTSQVGIGSQVEVQIDVLEFQVLADRCLAGPMATATVLADLRQAVGLYRGDLLEGFYDDWVLIERERLRELYLQALERLVTAYKVALQYQQALVTAQRLVSADPLNEAAHREVMRLYHYLGCPADALRQYDTCREVLRREFDLEPEIETRQIAQAVARHAGREEVPYLPEPQVTMDGRLIGHAIAMKIPLIGRSKERSILVDWLRQTQTKCGRLILVEGEAGVGKTRLLQEVGRDMEWYGAQVLWGKAMPLMRNRPLEPLVSALEGALTPLWMDQLRHLVEPVWLQALQPLLPGLVEYGAGPELLAALEGQQAKIRLSEGLYRLLAAWARINPLVILLEDVHWVSAENIEFLENLAARLEREDVTLVLSCRKEELAGLPEIRARLDAIQPEVVRGRLPLLGLDASSVHELIRACLGAGNVSPNFMGILSRATHGNPLFILEVLRSLYDEGVLRKTETGDWITPYDSIMGEVDLPLPLAVEQVILHRLEQLPPDLRGLLEGLAVLGGDYNFERVACLGLAEAPVLVSQLKALCQRRLLVESTRAYHFSHDKIRQVVYESLNPEQRATWHSRLAVALEQNFPEQVEALSYHYTLAQAWDKAVDYYQRSAEKARRANAYATAAEHLHNALALADRAQLSIETRFQLLEMRLDILGVLGDMGQYRIGLEAMIRLAGEDAHRLAQISQKQIEFLLQTSCYAEAEAAARQALRLAEDQRDYPFQAAALDSLGIILDIRGDRQAATACLERAIHFYQQEEDRRGEAEARGHLANVLAKSEQRTAARAEFVAVLALFEAMDYQPGCADTLAVLGVLSDFDGDFDASIRYCTRSLEICRRIGYRKGEAYASHEMGSALLKFGQIGNSVRIFENALEICLAIGERRLEATTRFFLSSIYCNFFGNYLAAIHEAQAGLATARAIADPIIQGMCLNYLGDACLKAGKLDEARGHLKDSMEVFRVNNSELRMPEVYLSLAKYYLSCTQLQAALEALEMAETLNRKYVLEVNAESLFSLRAEILLALDRPQEAIEYISKGISRLSLSSGNIYKPYFIYYQVLSRLGCGAEARQALERAYQGLMHMLEGLSPEQQEMSRRCVPVHRAILEAWQAVQPRRIEMRLRSTSAPLGRQLKEGEWVQVSWTVTAPEDEAIAGRVERRRARVQRLIQEARDQGAAATTESLAEALGVSVRTIASDLAALEADLENFTAFCQ
jgi:predicted ATPase/DNA-binding SARP family transcriptional activator